MTSAHEKPVLILICGATASGKTDFAVQLARQFNTEILSVDSRQVYKEISIGTAKPSKETLREIKHHFINHCSIHTPYNAGVFEQEATSLLNTLFIKHRVVIAAGGTGLYIKALCEGLDDLPIANDELRLQLQEELETKGVDFLFHKLQTLDMEGSKTIDSKNPHRIMRAIELTSAAHKSILSLKTKGIQARPYQIVKIKMDVDRSTLYKRINERVDRMIEQGLVDEAKNVYAFKHLKALKTVGYTELFEYFDGSISLNDAIEKIKQHTRNYAKRQTTWFKKETDSVLHTQFQAQDI